MSDALHPGRFAVRVGLGALGAMLAVSGVLDLRIGAFVDGILQLGLAFYLIHESIPSRERSEESRQWLRPALVTAGVVFLVLRTVLRAETG